MRRVVLVGGGYVTLHAYRQLVRRLRPQVRTGSVEIVVISADDCHNFHGFTGEVLAGLLPLDRTRTPLAEACPLARVLHATVTHVDPATRTVRYRRAVAGSAAGAAGEERLRYDQLVVGTGGREPAGAVPGLAEHGFTLRAPGDLRALQRHLRGSCAQDPAAARSVVVAGGGLAGVELAAAIADFGRGALDVLLVHPGEQLAPELRHRHPRLADRAERELRRAGVRVRPRTRLTAVTPHGVVLEGPRHLAPTAPTATSTASGHDGAGPTTRVHPAGTVLATIGQRPVQLPGLGGLVHDARGRLATRPDLSVTDGIWAAGDVARVLHPGTGAPVPANALWAIKGGAQVGRNAARTLCGRPTRPFRYRGLGQAASFGLGKSVATLYGVEFTGVLAWTLRLVFFLRFMPSRRRAGQVLRDLASLRTRQRVTDLPPARDGIPAAG